MKRWILVLAVVGAATALPMAGCSDDSEVTDTLPEVRDDGGTDVPDETTPDDADVPPEDVDVPPDVPDPCLPTTCPNDPTDGPVGGSCIDTPDCTAGFDCWTEQVDVFNGLSYIRWPGGYCLPWGRGDLGCDPDVAGSCPDGSSCVYFGEDTEGRRVYGCLDSCSVASSSGVPWHNNCDCRDGYECSLGGEFCYSGCSNDRECCEIWHDGDGGAEDGMRQAGEVTELPATECTDTCDPCRYACILNGCPGGACRIGDPCEHESDCPRNGRCLSEYSYSSATDNPFPGGMCIQDRCDLDGLECPLGSGCGNLGSTSDPFYTCVIPCDVGTEPGDTGFPCRDTGEAGRSEGDYACMPASDGLWFDSTRRNGFCWSGNFTDGTGAIGSACTVDGDCDSPYGLGGCIDLADTPPQYCTIWCNADLALTGTCGGADGTTGIATGVCFSGLCLEACENPGALLGAENTGCTLDNMACYSLALFGTNVTVATGATAPAGLCFTACTSDIWCADMWGSGTCNTTTGVCAL